MSLFEAKEGTVNILDTLFFGVGAVFSQKTLIHFPNVVNLQTLEALPPQLNSSENMHSVGATILLHLICWAKSGGRTPELRSPGDCPQVGGAGERKW